MSKHKNRNSLLSSHSRSLYSNSTKDSLISMKYEMNRPELPLYPFNDFDSKPRDLEKDDIMIGETYPDFIPWKEEAHAAKDVENTAYLTKGYFEPPVVSNEYYSSRNMIQATIFSSSENCNEVLKELSQHLANAYKTRNEQINKIRYESNKFKIPSRVTLTALKKEIWLKDLANPDVPLHKIAGRIPHGIRNKVLIDSICSKSVPISRAIWFTKCVLFAESIAIRKKYASRLATLTDNGLAGENLETHWLQDWTQQVVDFVYKYSKELGNINQPEKKNSYMHKLKYLLEYIQTLYIEELLDKTYFLSSIFKFLKEGLPLEPELFNEIVALKRGDNDDTVSSIWLAELGFKFGDRLVALTIIKIFWLDILKYDFLCKELSELLLLNYFFIDKISANNPKHLQHPSIAVSQNLKLQIQDLITDSLVYLFKYNTNFFIIPTYWILLNELLFKIIGDEMNFSDENERYEVGKQLQLIKYRNESLMLNMRHIRHHETNNPKATVQNLTKSKLNISDSAFTNSPITFENSPETVDNTQAYFNRSSDDVLRIISQLDKLKPNEELAELLKPKLNNSAYPQWKITLKIVIYWCVAPYRIERRSNEDVLIICNFLKRKVLQKLPMDEDQTLKMEFENEILEIVYSLSEDVGLKISMYKLYVLINELYQLQVITISSYLRKLIASGIIYIAPGSDSFSSHMVQYHLSILQNLPVLNNKQCDSILKKWNSMPFNFREKFNKGKEILQVRLMDRIMTGSFEELLEDSLEFFSKLEVGLKFLLINWLTNQLKIAITNSPKLIHITPSIISALYKFYSMCDNLTVFFKGFVKFLLRNKGKIIISYLDSLYLTSSLVMKHFQLVKSIAGTAYESLTTAYELFKLIVINYKDLIAQDHDYFQSKDIWKFMEKVIENDGSEINSENYSQKILLRDQVETPMMIPCQDTSEEEYSSANFKNDLNMLLDNPMQLMKIEEIKGIIETLELDQKTYDLSSEIDIRISVKKQLEYLYKAFDGTNHDFVLLILKLLSNSKKLLESENLVIFQEQLYEYLLDIMRTGEDFDKICMFVRKLIAVSFVKVEDFVSLVRNSEQNIEGISNPLLYAILFGKSHGTVLSITEDLIVATICESYIVRHQQTCLDIVTRGLSSVASDQLITESYLWKEYKHSVLKFLNGVLIFQSKTFIDTFFNSISTEGILVILNEILIANGNDKIQNIQDICYFANQIDEFNLPIIQAMLKIILYELSLKQDSSKMSKEIEHLVSVLLDNCKFYFSPQNSYFGELFNYIDAEHKVNVLRYLEDLFLRETKFLEEPPYMRLTRDDGMKNIQPILKGFFKKFSSTSVIQTASSGDFFNNISQFLQNLLQFVNKYESDDENRSIYFTISIFLRILIIHQSTLTSAIIDMDNTDFWFVKNLISLLNTKFMANNEKLKILLYDLLLLLKSSVTLAATLAERACKPNQEIPMSYSVSEMAELSEPGVNLEDFDAGGKLSNMSQISTVFNLPEPHNTDSLKAYVDDSKIQCVLTLEKDELENGGDIHSINNSGLVLIDSRIEGSRDSNEFNGLDNHQQVNNIPQQFKIKSFELLKDTSLSLNDGCINILLFDSYTTRENPP